jgi:hypothetical protein
MSASPGEDALIVALDFQGIHSPERSAEEDILFALFNTAISNLVSKLHTVVITISILL